MRLGIYKLRWTLKGEPLGTAADLYTRGRRNLLLDLCQTTHIELSGLFALCNVTCLYSGLPLIEPDSGWRALRAAAEAVTPTLAERVKVLAPSSVATAALASSSLCQFLEQYPDQESALTALPNP